MMRKMKEKNRMNALGNTAPLATWPFSRASCFFLGVASSVFSPANHCRSTRMRRSVIPIHLPKPSCPGYQFKQLLHRLKERYEQIAEQSAETADYEQQDKETDCNF